MNLLLEHGKTKVLHRISGPGMGPRFDKLLKKLHGDNLTSENHPTHKGVKLWYDAKHELVGVLDNTKDKIATVYGYPDQHRAAGAHTAVLDGAVYDIEQLGLTPLEASGKADWLYSVVARGRVPQVVEILDAKHIPYRVSTQKIYFGGEVTKEEPEMKSLSTAHAAYESILAQAGFKLTLTEGSSGRALTYKSTSGKQITVTSTGQWTFGDKKGTSVAMLESVLTGKTTARGLMAESVAKLSESPDGPLELATLVKAFPNYHMKAFQKLWGGHRLTWQGMSLFNNDSEHSEDGFTKIVNTAQNEILSSEVAVDIRSAFGADSTDIRFGGSDLQECYLGYDAKDNTLYVGFDAWAPEEELEDLVQTYADEDTGGKADDDAYARAWSKFNDNSPGFIGILVQVTGRPGSLKAEVVDARSGGFYSGIYRKMSFKHLQLKDLRLD